MFRDRKSKLTLGEALRATDKGKVIGVAQYDPNQVLVSAATQETSGKVREGFSNCNGKSPRSCYWAGLKNLHVDRNFYDKMDSVIAVTRKLCLQMNWEKCGR